MRSELEIYRAHDLLTGVALEEVNVKINPPMAIHCALDVLCWVLGHDLPGDKDRCFEPNSGFARNLATIEEELSKLGIELIQKKPFPEAPDRRHEFIALLLATAFDTQHSKENCQHVIKNFLLTVPPVDIAAAARYGINFAAKYADSAPWLTASGESPPKN